MISGSAWSWYNSSLESFLSDEHQLDSSGTGLLFLIFGISYTIFNPLYGYLMDKMNSNGLSFICFGSLMIAISFVFLGPIPQLDKLEGNLWLTGLSIGELKGQLILGFAKRPGEIALIASKLLEGGK